MIYLKVGRARGIFHTVCILGILLGLGASVQAEPIYNPSNGHYYERYDPQPGLGYTWQDAHALVDGAMGTLYYQGVLGDLVGVETQGEHDWLVQNLSTASGLLGYWTGGWQHNPSESIATDPNAYARNWDWAGGGAFGAWTNWGPGQPDDGGVFGGYEDNLIYWNDNKWNDLGGGETYVMQADVRIDFGFIVEFTMPPPPQGDPTNLVPVAPISAIGFQDADDFGQQPTQVDVLSGVSAQDGVWSPQDVTPVGDVTNDVYATGTSEEWLDAISLEFEDPKLVNGQSWLRVYLQKGYVASDWQHLMLLPGLFNSDFEDDNPTGIDINPGGELPDNTTIGWFDIPFDTNVMPAYILPNGNIGMTLRLWNMRVDAIELLVSDLMGDINLDGFVDDDDMSLLLANWGTGNEWGLGDLNEDGTVDDDDLSLLLANWHTGTLPPMGGDPVPEPATMLMLGIGGVGALLRRKR